jgi:hypothetical protein
LGGGELRTDVRCARRPEMMRARRRSDCCVDDEGSRARTRSSAWIPAVRSAAIDSRKQAKGTVP